MMKKILCTLALTLMAFMTHAQMLPETGTSRLAAASTKTGDVNGDYKVNVDDVVMIIQYLIEQAGSDFLTFNADVNRDGVITISDAVATALLILEGDKPQSYLSCPDNNHPHLIDLGLPSGTLWSCCDVSGYFAWGETEVKTVYDEVTYKYCTGEDTNGDGWYDGNVSYQSIGSDIAGSQYDVAHVKWGGNWVMPSYEQIKELLDNCTKKQPYIDDDYSDARVSFTGPNGGSIILSTGGYISGDFLDCYYTEGFYWSSTQSSSEGAYILNTTYSGSANLRSYSRYVGLRVRPVFVGNTSYPLALSINSVDVRDGESATVEITSGNGYGFYSVSSSNPNVATASVSGVTITITGVTDGTAVVTVTDTSTGSSLDIRVNVTTVKLSCPDSNHPHMIDLGLPSGTKWACCNVDADKPEAYGGYYAWGETEEKSNYDWSSYIHCDGSKDDCHDIGNDIAGTQYDVAHVKWGNNWMMPSLDQIKELFYCTNVWTTINGVKGWRFTGINGGTIFIPAAGLRQNDDFINVGSYGYYWSSTQDPTLSYDAYSLMFYSGHAYWKNGRYRLNGHTVRPVGNTTKPLALSMSSVEMHVGESATVEITSGNGAYTVSSSRTNVATASLSGNTITIIGVAAGSAVVTVTDTTTGNSLNISVTVTAAKPQSYLSCPDGNHPHMIDLGLPSGTKWACCNVGADKPEAYGGYYAWGETEEKNYYDWSTYIYCDGSSDTCYNLGSDIAGTQYDVAHVKWGGSWVMPSYDQNKELIENCNHEWTTMNGVNGIKFTSKKNGGIIFLPAAGYRWNDDLYYAGSGGYYWSSTQLPSYSGGAYVLYFDSVGAYWGNDILRSYGHTVRPVSSN